MKQKVTIIGLGFVGLSFAAFLGSKNISVIGVDSNKKKIECLREGAPDFYEPKLEYYLKKGIKNILVEGGGTTNWAFVKENLVDEAIITITPYLVGGMHATTLVDGDGFSTIAKSIKLKLKKITKIKNEIILHYEN